MCPLKNIHTVAYLLFEHYVSILIYSSGSSKARDSTLATMFKKQFSIAVNLLVKKKPQQHKKVLLRKKINLVAGKPIWS